MKKFNRFLGFAVPILLLTITLTSHLCTGLFAKYLTADQESDGARVASFEVWDDLSPTTVNLSMLPGEKITVRVRNKSETSVCCFLKVENMTLNLPIANPDPIVIPTKVIGAGDSDEVTLELEWNALDNDSSYAGMIDLVSVTLIAEQVD